MVYNQRRRRAASQGSVCEGCIASERCIKRARCERLHSQRHNTRVEGTSAHAPFARQRCACPAQACHAAPSRADPETAAPRRRYIQTRNAPFTSCSSPPEIDAAPARVGQFRRKCGTRAASSRKAFPGRIEPRASRAQPAPARSKPAESRRNSARAAAASAHTPTARRKCACPASRRLTPRRPRNSRAAPLAHPDARRTLQEPRGPPETDAERARVCGPPSVPRHQQMAPALVARNHARLGDVQRHVEVAIAVETLLSADGSWVRDVQESCWCSFRRSCS